MVGYGAELGRLGATRRREGRFTFAGKQASWATVCPDRTTDRMKQAPREPRPRPAGRANDWEALARELPEAAPSTLSRVNAGFATDVAMLGLGAAIAGASDESVSQGGLGWGIAFVAITFIALKLRGAYDYRVRLSPLRDLTRLVGATSTAAILVLSARLLSNDVPGAGAQAVRLWLATTICLAAGRALLALWLRGRRLRGRGLAPTLIIGAGPVGHRLARRLTEHPELGLRPVGFLDDEAERADGGEPGDPPLLGSTWDLDDLVRREHVGHVIVAFAAAPHEVLVNVIRRCGELGVRVSVVPRLFEEVTRRIEVEHLGGIPLMRTRRVDPKGWHFGIKYLIDRAVAGIMLILISPLWLAIALGVKLSSRGPVFFRQPRVGLDGHEFMMLKFRTMRGEPGADGEWDAAWAAQVISEAGGNGNGDALAASSGSGGGGNGNGGAPEVIDRRTGIGRFLRKTSLDELPQLLNVLVGDMSLVGPRPERTAYVRAFQEHVYRYGDRHRVKSGLTGWAQVHGLRGDSSLADRVEWDNYYIENWSLVLDCQILFLTVPAMLARETG